MIHTTRSYKSFEKRPPIEKTHNPVVVYTKYKLFKISSMSFAKMINKTHTHIMRDIRRLKCSVKFRNSNFLLDMRIAGNNRRFPYYKITQKGAALLYSNYRLTSGYKEAIIEEIFSNYNL